MNNKFYNYLYDYMVKEGFVKDTNPKDQKEKLLIAREYLDKINRTHIDSRLDILRKMYLDRYVIKYEDIPDSYFKHQEQLYLERGFGHHTLTEQERKETAETVINDQKVSLERILDYFFSEDARFYPDYLRFWAFQGIINLGSYDKKTEKFGRRTKGTVVPYIDINREALALSINEINKYIKGEEVEDINILESLFKNQGGLNNSFSRLYTYYLNKVNNSKKSNINSNEGVWIKYAQGSDHIKLVKSLEGKGTGWCTAGESTAKLQLSNGDFYVYYTKGETGKYTEPRIAIRMDGHDKIGEIRGVAPNQNIESDMEGIVDNKLEEFPDRDKYKKKVSDMRLLTTIYKKHQKQEELSIEELRFLYEIDDKIQGFGYQKDPRIKEIIGTRDIRDDLSKVFNCSKEEIGLKPKDALSYKQLKFYYGDLDLSYLRSAKGIKLPQRIGGALYLSGLTNAKDLTLPQSIGGFLELTSLTSAEGLTLPQRIGGGLYLSGLISANGLTLPQRIGWNVNLANLASAEGLIFPQEIEGNLYLGSLTSAEGLTLPQSIGGDLYLGNLTSTNGLTLPQRIGGNLNLASLASADGLNLPQRIGGDLVLRSLTSAEGLILPEEIGGDLFLGNLTSTNGLTLPQSIGGDLDLRSLISAKGLVFPDNYSYGYVIAPPHLNIENKSGRRK